MVDLNAVASGLMACQNGVTLALLSFENIASFTAEIARIDSKRAEHKRGMDHAGLLVIALSAHTYSRRPAIYCNHFQECRMNTPFSP